MTYVPPCARPENDPNDWFIEKDGRQYSDDDLVTEAAVNLAADQIEDFDKGDLEAWEALVEKLEGEAVRAQLVRRRHAKDKCFTDCYFRTTCLARGLDEAPMHGIWGGYYPEELRKIRELRDERRTSA